MLETVQKWEAERAAAAWRRAVDARIQGLGHAIYCMQQAAQAWGVGAELQGKEASCFIEQKQERSTVRAQGWVGGGDNDEDKEHDKENNMVVKKDACVKSHNMIVRKNSKKKADVATEESGERLIK